MADFTEISKLLGLKGDDSATEGNTNQDIPEDTQEYNNNDIATEMHDSVPDVEIAASDDKVAKLAELKKEYTELQSSAMAAAKRGYIDDIIEPDATRKRVIAALDMLFTKEDVRPFKKHGTV